MAGWPHSRNKARELPWLAPTPVEALADLADVTLGNAPAGSLGTDRQFTSLTHGVLEASMIWVTGHRLVTMVAGRNAQLPLPLVDNSQVRRQRVSAAD